MDGVRIDFRAPPEIDLYPKRKPSLASRSKSRASPRCTVCPTNYTDVLGCRRFRRKPGQGVLLYYVLCCRMKNCYCYNFLETFLQTYNHYYGFQKIGKVYLCLEQCTIIFTYCLFVTLRNIFPGQKSSG